MIVPGGKEKRIETIFFRNISCLCPSKFLFLFWWNKFYADCHVFLFSLIKTVCDREAWRIYATETLTFTEDLHLLPLHQLSRIPIHLGDKLSTLHLTSHHVLLHIPLNLCSFDHTAPTTSPTRLERGSSTFYLWLDHFRSNSISPFSLFRVFLWVFSTFELSRLAQKNIIRLTLNKRTITHFFTSLTLSNHIPLKMRHRKSMPIKSKAHYHYGQQAVSVTWIE